MPAANGDDELVPIPRPAQFVPGRPAPWVGLAPTERTGLTLGRVLEALERAGHLGAAPAPHRVAGQPPLPPVEADPPSPSAVLVPLFEEDGEARVVLTRRSAALRSHRGQVSFPGGRIDPGEDPPTAARREAFEEVGIDPASVSVVGWLDPLFTISAGAYITPVVGTLPGRPRYVVSPAEVARVFDVSLAQLPADGVFHEERWNHLSDGPGLGAARAVWFFEVDGETVWGATARVLVQLCSVVLGLPFDQA
jgi:8-oxo-dGTP pyrophosphatase MutT (NUDIX family)